MPVNSAPVISGNQNLTDVLLKVTMAWPSWQSTAPSLPGWHLINASEIGMSASQLTNGVYQNSNAEAIVAAATYNGHRTLAVGFRGTNDNEDWRQDFQNINEHFDLFAPLVTALNAVAARGEFDLILATGHSLGGAMTQMFMADYAGISPAYAITTGSPGYLQEKPVADSRIINYQVTDDPIVYLGGSRALVGQTLSSPFGALMVNQLASSLSSSFGFPASTFTSSIPYLTQNYYNRGTVEVLKVPGHPDSPPTSPLALVTSYNPDAHEFPAYLTGISATNRNPFDLSLGSRGTSGNDALFGTTSANTIDGGAGFDTLYLHISRDKANLTLGPNGLIGVSSVESGTDTLISVERLVFTDKRLAFDLAVDQSAGKAARLIGAAFDGAAITQHPDWMGSGLQIFDEGMSLLEACQLVVGLMGDPSNEAFVSTVFTNVAGVAPSEAELLHFTGMLEGSGGTMTKAQLLEQAALIDINEVNIGLVGLQLTGVEFI
ncbi:MAG: hypothetical protein Q8L60_05055 [Gammaproteobacteria bacterium]|nr:hypothetical protein [Gammaproteobacteria bacterium]MDP2140770.1 hypothetical protein [Gammaproteobacteria bacterium]MDP2347024.1 hypothetical protein [Gammaproteobacteria bacterium]